MACDTNPIGFFNDCCVDDFEYNLCTWQYNKFGSQATPRNLASEVCSGPCLGPPNQVRLHEGTDWNDAQTAAEAILTSLPATTGSNWICSCTLILGATSNVTVGSLFTIRYFPCDPSTATQTVDRFGHAGLASYQRGEARRISQFFHESSGFAQIQSAAIGVIIDIDVGESIHSTHDLDTLTITSNDILTTAPAGAWNGNYADKRITNGFGNPAFGCGDFNCFVSSSAPNEDISFWYGSASDKDAAFQEVLDGTATAETTITPTNAGSTFTTDLTSALSHTCASGDTVVYIIISADPPGYESSPFTTNQGIEPCGGDEYAYNGRLTNATVTKLEWKRDASTIYTLNIAT